MKPKYIIHPGTVKSKTDGDIHYISAPQLMRLHQVNPSECITETQAAGQDVTGLIHLYPSESGNYPYKNKNLNST